MIRMLRRLNEVLPDLVVLILGYGVLTELVGLIFVTDRFRYTAGIAIGTGLAICMAIHMAIVIEDSLSVQDKKGRFLVSLKGILRYAVVAAVVFVAVYFDIANILAIFIGIMGLKAAAYLQPKYHGLMTHITDKRKKEKEVRE